MAERATEATRQAVEYLNRLGKPARQAKVLVVGMDCSGRCNPQRPCTVRSLRRCGVLVDFYDPRLPEAECGGLRARGINRLTPDALSRYDMVILQQPCSRQEYCQVEAAARQLLDIRPNPKDCII